MGESYISYSKSMCRKCDHQNVCKWQNEKKRIDNDIKKIRMDLLCPIQITVDCINFRPKYTKMDGYKFEE